MIFPIKTKGAAARLLFYGVLIKTGPRPVKELGLQLPVSLTECDSAATLTCPPKKVKSGEGADDMVCNLGKKCAGRKRDGRAEREKKRGEEAGRSAPA